jgi:hypothetical protein
LFSLKKPVPTIINVQTGEPLLAIINVQTYEPHPAHEIPKPVNKTVLETVFSEEHPKLKRVHSPNSVLNLKPNILNPYMVIIGRSEADQVFPLHLSTNKTDFMYQTTRSDSTCANLNPSNN